MPLIELWKSNAAAIAELGIEQVLATAGDGNLRDETKCSRELREYFSKILSSKLAQYVEQCLTTPFARSGLVLQDLVNELGRRLDYDVENGKYQGTTQSIGFDGIWRSPEDETLVVEVKTTDAYRVSLERIASYRKQLLTKHDIGEDSSVLIVVGRQDTGELEAQVRGSRHAWDIRIISADALIKLVQLKENSEGGATAKKIRILLTPMEYTRLDSMVDVMFTTVTEVEDVVPEDLVSEKETDTPAIVTETTAGAWQFTDGRLIQAKREKIVSSIAKKFGTSFINKTRATLWSTDHTIRVAITISKRYTQRATYAYWYAYHPQWDEFMADGKAGFLVLGCMDLPFAFCIPRETISATLQYLNTTTTERSTYWHIHLLETAGQYELVCPKAATNLNLMPYKIDTP